MRALAGSARSLTHLQVRSLSCSPAAFASAAAAADSRFRTPWISTEMSTSR